MVTDLIMKYLKKFNESNSYIVLPNEISISDFIDRLNEKSKLSISKEVIINWWNNNLPNIRIFYFPFKINQIIGCCFSENRVVINSTSHSPSDIKLFIALHESKHTLQDDVEEKYFKTVINGDKESFMKNYRELENDANNFALNSLKEMGLNISISDENRLRSNENMGNNVYNMMSNDIIKTRSTTLSELFYKQIL